MNSLQNLQEQWQQAQDRKTPREAVDFLVEGGYTPFRRVSQDQALVLWVKKEYTRQERMYAQEWYKLGDATARGGVRTYGEVDQSGVLLDMVATTRKLADFFAASIEDFVPLPVDKGLLTVAKSFAVLVEHIQICTNGECEEGTVLRGLGGMIKR